MRLKTLEIKGFKSFADKTTLHFQDNITGVVGPNGCGKSNIVDAIRWVLGEQKPTMLRSEKMENLIFNGSKKRKSSSLAEVALTFENTKNILPTEYSTVTISRHYYRNGDSEYRLNDVPCRLKDITGLFMDTGIGSDSYAIIELGMVDDILNDKDNSRRKLFEQAAGIEKYKTRKKETFNKLNSTQADLDRVEDLLFEIEGNLKTLEGQARRTQRYYKLKEEYKTLSIELAVMMLGDRKDAYKRISTQLEQEEDKRLKVDADIAGIEAQVQKLKADQVAKEQALSKAQNTLNQHIHSIREHEHERNVNKEHIRNKEERLQRLDQDMGLARDSRGQHQERIGKLEIRLNEQDTKTENRKQTLEKVRVSLQDTEAKHKAAGDKHREVTQLRTAVDKEIYELEKQHAINQVRLDNLGTEIEKGSEQEKAGKDALDRLNKTLAGLEKQAIGKEKELEKLQQKEAGLKDTIASAEKLARKVRDELDQENRALDARRNEYQLTKDLIDNLEGYPESIKFLRKEVKHTKHAPLLSDIIACQDEYRGAIENYLEPYLNYYVVNTWEEARDSINILSDAAKGRANFFILSEFDDYKGASTIRTDNATSALEVLEVEPKYFKLAAYLLDNVYLTDDIEAPEVRSSRHEGKAPVFLTRNGKFVRSAFSLSGGAIGLFEGKKLGRSKSLDKLQRTIKKHETRTEEIARQLHAMQKQQDEQTRQLAETNTLMTQVREAFQEARQEIASIRTSIQHAQQSIGHASDKFVTTMERIKAVEEENNGLLARLNELQEKQAGLLAEEKATGTAYTKVTEKVEQLREAYNTDNLGWHQEDNLRRQIAQELHFNKQQLEQAEKTIQSGDKETVELTEALTVHYNRVKELEKGLQQMYTQKEEMELGVREAEQAYHTVRGDIEAAEGQMRELQQQRQQVSMLVDSLKEKLNDLKLNLASMKERLSVEFNTDINDLISREPSGEFTLEELGERVDRVKDKIERFGEINPMAVEAFNEMKERFDFITAQKLDLTEAKNNLLRTIEEIDTTAKAQFFESFEKVRHNFQQVFRTLFTNDDTCDLVLLDPSEPLDSKIEIIAKPKGKKPLTINQLSGGEKTLTATALLFALYLIKPAPFCVFDEVDAPLDDTNIGKFTNIVREFSKDSQFIIVTHNKQTMSTVDVIYGVTMVEEGVSRVVPVDFRNLN